MNIESSRPARRESHVEAVPALIACVAIGFAVLAAERKLAMPLRDPSGERPTESLLAPAPLTPPVPGEKK